MKMLLAFVLIAFSGSADARDKIGNGGGGWACVRDGHISDLRLVDFFEATSERPWILRSFSDITHEEVIRRMRNIARIEFPKHSVSWEKALDRVLASIYIAPVELNVIDDGLFRATPQSSECLGGTWEYKQIANFNQFDEVTISSDLWQNAHLYEFEKAGLIWHEAIYLWLRETFDDQDSVRARYITGLIFAEKSKGETMTPALKNALLEKTLSNSTPPTPPNPPPVREGYVCMIENMISHKMFSDYGRTENAARLKTIQTCQGENHPNHCFDTGMECDRLTNDHVFTCEIKHGISFKTFFAEGQSVVEAKFNSFQECAKANPAQIFHCNQASWRCE